MLFIAFAYDPKNEFRLLNDVGELYTLLIRQVCASRIFGLFAAAFQQFYTHLYFITSRSRKFLVVNWEKRGPAVGM